MHNLIWNYSSQGKRGKGNLAITILCSTQSIEQIEDSKEYQGI